MSTRSIIAEPHGAGWRGRYCHWDGYPAHQVVALLGIVHAKGTLSVARAFLLAKRWSSLDPDPEKCQGETAEAWVSSHGNDAGAEWAYVLTEAGVQVYVRVPRDGSLADGSFGQSAAPDGAWLPVGLVPYSATPAQGELIDLECGKHLERCRHRAWVHFPDAKDTQESVRDWLGKTPRRLRTRRLP